MTRILLFLLCLPSLYACRNASKEEADMLWRTHLTIEQAVHRYIFLLEYNVALLYRANESDTKELKSIKKISDYQVEILSMIASLDSIKSSLVQASGGITEQNQLKEPNRNSLLAKNQDEIWNKLNKINPQLRKLNLSELTQNKFYKSFLSKDLLIISKLQYDLIQASKQNLISLGLPWQDYDVVPETIESILDIENAVLYDGDTLKATTRLEPTAILNNINCTARVNGENVPVQGGRVFYWFKPNKPGKQVINAGITLHAKGYDTTFSIQKEVYVFPKTFQLNE